MKKNIKILKELLQVCLLCPTILHQELKHPQAQAVLIHKHPEKSGVCEKSKPEIKKTHHKKKQS